LTNSNASGNSGLILRYDNSNGIQIQDSGFNTFLTQGTPNIPGQIKTIKNTLDDSVGNMTLVGSLFLPTTGGSASALNYYENTTISATWITGPSSNLGSAFNINAVRVGNMVTFGFPNQSFTGNVSTQNFQTITGTIPVRLTPSGNRFVIPVVNSNNFQFGQVRIDSNGKLSMIGDSTAGGNTWLATGTNTNSWPAFNISGYTSG
jgi:hypothetical protein